MKELYSNEVNVWEISTSVRGDLIEPSTEPTLKVYTSSDKNFTTFTSITAVPVEVDGAPVVGRYAFSIPPSILKLKRYAKLEASYELPGHGVITSETIVDITQRIVSFEEVNYILGLDTLGDSYEVSWFQYDKLETISRKVIEAYIGQPLNHWQGTREIYANRNYVGLPQHMETLDTVAQTENVFVETVGSNYFLTESGLALTNQRSFPIPDFLVESDKVNVTHSITGEWGYRGLPSAITQAGIEVILMFNTDTVNSRRLFLSNMRDDRSSTSLRFNWMSYTDSTGNPIADDLLDQFRIYNAYAI